MVGVTTVALLERKPGMSRDLFSRYWRDIHGVMAARIPGFASYTQHHVTPFSAEAEPFEGIAIVTFASEDDRQGLATSAMTGHIHRDEQNVFRRALLYNLTAGADTLLIDGEREHGQSAFVVVPRGVDPVEISSVLLASGPTFLARFNLTTGDPAAWNATDVDEGGRGRRFATLLQGVWPDAGSASGALARVSETAAATYWLDQTFVLVESGRATPVGLRGWDAVRTIDEAGADNQLTMEVEDALYKPGSGG
ncbi:EthD domain-containing protein [Novosphingobium lentum]|uniref:EthD domain-containing protein n=1 Tax=Novosphingobium lentum TaxID=145287 RepID=UPI00082DC4E7|nr:EthD domain-containing protein [Novosphingobium lentum]